MKEESQRLLARAEETLTLAGLDAWLGKAFKARLLGVAEGFLQAILITDDALSEAELSQLGDMIDSVRVQVSEVLND